MLVYSHDAWLLYVWRHSSLINMLVSYIFPHCAVFFLTWIGILCNYKPCDKRQWGWKKLLLYWCGNWPYMVFPYLQKIRCSGSLGLSDPFCCGQILQKAYGWMSLWISVWASLVNLVFELRKRHKQSSRLRIRLLSYCAHVCVSEKVGLCLSFSSANPDQRVCI